MSKPVAAAFTVGAVQFGWTAVITFLLLVVVLILCLLMTHNMRVHHISKKQAAAESVGGKLLRLGEKLAAKKKLLVGILICCFALILSLMVSIKGIRPLNVESAGEKVGRLAEILNEEMASATVFSIGPLSFDEGTVVTWIIMAVILIGCLILTHDLKVESVSKRQALAEFIVTKLEGMTADMLGEKGMAYSGYLIAVLIYLGFANISNVFGFKPPTKGLNVTAALAVMSIVLVQIAGIRAKGVKGWLKAFTQPVGVITPFNILDLFTRPLSLCMRLFGNVLAAFVIMKVLETVVPLFLPAVFCLYFDFFDGLLQAYVFVFLTGLYISEAVE